MKFFIINTDYSDFQRTLYSQHPGLAKQSYQEQMRVRIDSFFGTGDFYSRNLGTLGHESRDALLNVEPLQRQWARENSLVLSMSHKPIKFRLRRGIVPWVSREKDTRWICEILAAQIKAFRPDVVYSMALQAVDSDFLRSVQGFYGVAVGQHASQLPSSDLSEYDLILSSLPNQVDYFRTLGIKSELFRLGFEPKVLTRLSLGPKKYDVAFVGGVGYNFTQGTRMLEELCRRRDVCIWGYGSELLPKASPIHAAHQGQAWGLQMYQILHDAKIVFNRHIDFAENHANNMRLYESTGVGAMLLTDKKKDLNEIFAPNREVITYETVEECVELADYYLEHESERAAVAQAGQQRTLTDYNYLKRMQELVGIVERLFRDTPPRTAH